MTERSLIAEESREEKDAKKKDHASISRKYYTIPEEDLQALLRRAKKGDTVAQSELLLVFSNFLKKYVTLLMQKRCDLRDYDIRRFVSLFTRPAFSARVRRNQIDEATYREVNEVLRGLNSMVTRYGDKEDVEQTISVSFLQCVARYERRGEVPFSGFLYNYFLFILEKNVKEFLISQLGRKTFGLYTEDEASSSYPMGDQTDMSSINKSVHKNILVEENEYYTLGAETIDSFWVGGDSATYPFNQLSVNQRQLLKWRYIDGLKAPSIAQKTSEHPNTCRAQLHKIKEDLEDILGDQLPDFVDFNLLDIADD